MVCRWLGDPLLAQVNPSFRGDTDWTVLGLYSFWVTPCLGSLVLSENGLRVWFEDVTMGIPCQL